MRKRVFVRPAAERDLEKYGRYFAKHSGPLAKRFLAAASQTFRHLLRMPISEVCGKQTTRASPN